MGKICTLDILNGYVINQIRLEAGYKKQGELGEKFGMSHAAIGKIERGESSVSLEFLTILAEMIGTRSSKILAVVEDLADYLQEHEVIFMNQASFNIFHEMLKNGEYPESDSNLLLPSNVEDHITLELKKKVRELVQKKPDLDVIQVQKDFTNSTLNMIGAEALTATGVGIATGIALLNPLIGIGIGASLLATKLLKNKKAP